MSVQILSGNGSPEQTYARQQLAAAITAKGVETDPKAPFNVMAENIRNISRTQYSIDGNAVKDAQNYAGGALYDLYEVLYQVKNDIRVQGKYNGIILAEYFRGYDSIALQNADAFITCDGDFYENMTTHVWHDDETGKADRWVAYLFVEEYSDYTIPSVKFCPRSIFIGGKVGIISCDFYGRISAIVVPDEPTEDGNANILKSVRFTAGNPYSQNLIIRNMETLSGVLFDAATHSPSSIFMSLGVKTISSIPFTFANKAVSFIEMDFPELVSASGFIAGKTIGRDSIYVYDSLLRVYAPKMVSGSLFYKAHDSAWDCKNLIDVEVGAYDVNLDMRYWYPTNVIADATKLALLNTNIRNHIAAKVSDRTGQSALTFTVYNGMYKVLEQATKDAFTAKNWNVAGVNV